MTFDEAFQSLTGFPPVKWQRRLFKRFAEFGLPKVPDIPVVCDIPKGLGKTSIIVIWLPALVKHGESSDSRLPRRLVYVVNREQEKTKLSRMDSVLWGSGGT